MVLVTSLAAFVYCTVNLVLEYTSYRRHRYQHQHQRDDVYLPSITVCNLNPIRSLRSTVTLSNPRRITTLLCTKCNFFSHCEYKVSYAHEKFSFRN